MGFNEISLKNAKFMLESAKTGKRIVFAWDQSENAIIKAEMTIVSYSLRRNELVLNPIQSSRYYLNNMVKGEGRIKFFIPEYSLFYVGEIKKWDENLVIGFPSEFLVYDRREAERFTVDEIEIFCEITINKKTIKKKCFDLGLGGMAFFVNKNEKLLFEKDWIIEKINISYAKDKMTFSGKVISIDEIKPGVNEKLMYKSTRVAVRFLENDELVKSKFKRILYAIEQIYKKGSDHD